MTRFFRPALLPTILTLLALPILIALGLWQLQRLEWKQALIARIEVRTALPPLRVANLEEEALANLDALEYRPVRITGTFRHGQEVHWFGQNARGGVGYHVITPLALSSGGYVFVDRGFVPVPLKEARARPAGQIEGEVTITGFARLSAEREPLDAADDVEGNVWFVRSVPAMAQALGLGPVASFLVEAAGPPQSASAAEAAPEPLWQEGRPPPVVLRNDHLQYALTWFGLAGTLVGVYLAYHIAQGRLGLRKS